MKLRVIDYRPHTGGGKRFVVQLVNALHAGAAGLQLEFLSHGEALAQIRAMASEHGIHAGFIDLTPGGLPTAGFSWYQVPPAALDDCDVAWFPWIHHHRIPADAGRHVVGTFHDALMFTEPQLTSRFPSLASRERETTRQWLESAATLVCSSQFTRDVLHRDLHSAPDRLSVVTLSGRHVASAAMRGSGTSSLPWLNSPFLLCPANVSWHKNHEVLLEAYAESAVPWPLVLTGTGSDLVNWLPPVRRALRRVAVAVGLRPPHRSAVLRRLVRRLALADGQAIVPMGYLSDADYETVLDHAACLVMPTLGEGGGSFPVEEAVLRGVPVICSDIPVMREHMARLGASVTWFDPMAPRDLAACLREIKDHCQAVRLAAREQVHRLRVRDWTDVAADYMNLFRAAGSVRGSQAVG